jgi:hypothetical protein
MATGKLSQYSIHTEKALVIKIIDVLNKRLVIDFLDCKNDTEHVNEKHEKDRFVCEQNGAVIRRMRFKDAIKAMNSFIMFHGGMLLSHNLPGDLRALVDTQNLVRGPRIIKNKLVEFPNTGMYDKNWREIKTVCTMSLFCNRCRKMNTEYKKWVSENKIVLHRGMNTLQSLVQFVKRDPGYRQTHSAVQDTLDLFMVLRYAYKCDGSILDGYSYMNKPNWLVAS